MTNQTAAQYAKTEILAGRFPVIGIEPNLFDGFYLTDADYRFLAGKSFATRDQAETARSKAIKHACRFIQ
jgi:hypothetical protein